MDGEWGLLPCLHVCNMWRCQHSLAGQIFQLFQLFCIHSLAKNKKEKEKDEEENCKKPDCCWWLDVRSHVSAGCCGVLTRAEQLWSRGDALGSLLGCHGSTSPYKFCCPSTGWPLEFTSRAKKALKGESFQSPNPVSASPRHPAGDKQRLWGIGDPPHTSGQAREPVRLFFFPFSFFLVLFKPALD